jgi:acetyl-CoA carboxylase carboxyl transferase subunit beta
MPKPEGYRKAIRLMKQAEKFHRPVITFINTSGAFCGVDAEERGQGQAIAQAIMEMAMLKTPTLSILIGEGGSGGALATAVGNEVWMLEHATYSVLSPEGYSAILWKTEGRAEEAAAAMKLTAQDLAELQIIDRIIPEFGGATEQTVDQISAALRSGIEAFLKTYENMTGHEIMAHRYNRFRKF